jgi:hypothetical protein
MLCLLRQTRALSRAGCAAGTLQVLPVSVRCEYPALTCNSAAACLPARPACLSRPRHASLPARLPTACPPGRHTTEARGACSSSMLAPTHSCSRAAADLWWRVQKRKYCGVCMKVWFPEDEDMVCCDHCNLWIHAECDPEGQAAVQVRSCCCVAVLRCAVPLCAVLCCAVLCCATLHVTPRGPGQAARTALLLCCAAVPLCAVLCCCTMLL